MSADEHHRRLHFARIRRVKFWLRYMPRRARFHTYPLVGRFAAFARKRNYLWSFNYAQLRPAFYLGWVLTLLPVLGQLPIAFGLCLLFRTNFMILGGLQFASNLLTLPFLIGGCYFLGDFVMRLTGIDRFADHAAVAVPTDGGVIEPGTMSTLITKWSAVTIGGLIAGLVLGALTDLVWRRLVLTAARHRQLRRPVTAVVTPHDDANPPPSSAPLS